MSGVRELDEYRNKRINNNGGDGEMSNFATLKDLEHVEEKMSSKLENLEEKMSSKLENLEEKIGSKLENLEEKMGSKLENLEEKMDHKLELTEKNIEIMFLKEREYHRKNKIDSIKWIVGTGIGIVGLVFTYLKFFAS
ncbi:hypothetical protein CQZ94_11045 [Bacillus sp. MYb209]|uniref:hypothetical protein n=1 Tax=Bacillus TaxID=1386 RepID=UPI000CFCDB9F|nr:hypothetical protein [Bacillus sp. MYb209]PQZ57358.1 hypothetical protein CQZ94_11045 [Bacillus sp. MYb209]